VSVAPRFAAFSTPVRGIRGRLRPAGPAPHFRFPRTRSRLEDLFGPIGDRIHIGSGLPLDFFNGPRAWDFARNRPLTEDLPADVRARIIELDHRSASHLAVHMLDGATLAHGLSDSPAGLLAWLLERWNAWSDNGGNVESVFTKDDLLTHATIYWVNNSIATSMRYYANANRYPWTRAHDRTPVVEAPVGLTFVTYENPPGIEYD
jgi:hypothetical protein